ncbi:MAG: polymerase sigma-24 factor-like protein [Ramlibacter sp.]|jgi:RNA polymerase sigma factor (sigma-70 family)|nr:polymerase sigma-24 factor-like protein [Ramlibacter sp.]
MTSLHPDLQLIALIDQVAERLLDPARQRHSELALRELYDSTSTKLFGVAVKVCGNRNWAEDALQEAFITIWRSAGDYRSTLSPPLAWMGMIVRSRSLDFLRRRTSERADTVQELDDVMSDTVAGDSPDPVDTAQASEQAWALHECLRKLEARQREVVSLAYLRDLSHSELAEQLKLPLGTVKTWIRRGLEQLRGCMARVA